MKIYIDDGMQIAVGTGIGRYSCFLYESLKKNPANDIKLSDYESSGRNKTIERFKYLKYINSKKFRKKISEFDIVHFTNYAMPFKKHKIVKCVVTIHDLASFSRPDTLSKVYSFYNRCMVRNALKNADKIVVVSQSVKDEVAGRFPKYTDKIEVIYPGIYDDIKKETYSDNRFLNEKLNQNIEYKKVFLFVGTIEKRKNINMLLDAFISLKKKYSIANEFKLVLAGRPGYGYDDFVRKINESGFANDVILTGYIANEDCNKLYNFAKAYIFPSVYEGFGSTQLECMACGLPIILSDIPTNIEVSGKYGLFFNLNNMDSLTEQMRNIIISGYAYEDSLTAYLKKFDWDSIISDYENLYSHLL